MPSGLAQQTDNGLLRLADFRLEVCVEFVCYRKVRIQFKGSSESLTSLRLAVERAVDIFSHDAVTASQLGPRRSEFGVQLQTALVQITCPSQSIVGSGKFVTPKIKLVRMIVSRLITRRPGTRITCQRQ